VFASRRVVNFCAFAAVAKIHINSPPAEARPGRRVPVLVSRLGC